MAKKKNKILIVDDHRMVRDGICVMLESQKDHFGFSVDEAEDGEEAINKLKFKKYDLVIMDYKLPGMNGAEITRHITQKYRETKVLALSNSDEYVQVENMIKSGAQGFILKNIEPLELIKAIEAVIANQYYYSQEIAQKLAIYNLNNAVASNKKDEDALLKTLTQREKEILSLIIGLKTNEEIADILNISKRTVDTHRQKIFEKLNVKNTVALIKLASEKKLT